MIYSVGSGQAYTPSKIISIFDREWYAPLAAINSADMPWYENLDIRIEKTTNISGYNLNIYCLVLNALNHENVKDVLPSTGRADTDGWLATDEGQVWINSQSSVYPNADAVALYNDRLRNPNNWSSPRTMRLGVQVNF